MLEDVARAVDARPLAVPDRIDAVVVEVAEDVALLAAPDGGGRKVFIDAQLKLDVVLFDETLGVLQLLVEGAERRAAIAGDETGGRSRWRCIIGRRTRACVPVRKTRPDSSSYLSSSETAFIETASCAMYIKPPAPAA
ncbi:MAG: hypothetical protein P8X52_11215 [Limibacillus sp.]